MPIGELADVAEARGPVAARRRGLRRRRRGCRPATPPACRTSSARDSVTVDPHKWFFQAYDIGGLLVRDGAHLAAVFGGRAPEYYRGGETPVAGRRRPTTLGDGEAADDHGDQLNFYKLSFEGTRRWRALKLWMTWKHLGTTGFGRLIEANDDLAAHLARRCAEADDFEALPGRARAVRRVLPPPPGRRCARTPAGARRPPGPAAGRARGVRRRLADDDPAARRDLAARRDRQLPLDRGRHRPAARRRCGALAG